MEINWIEKTNAQERLEGWENFETSSAGKGYNIRFRIRISTKGRENYKYKLKNFEMLREKQKFFSIFYQMSNLWVNKM